jgi:transcriptional regulator of acetoin/glycerol metabolism
MGRPGQTVTDEIGVSSATRGDPIPGVLVIHSNGVPLLRAEALVSGHLEIGRASFGGKALDDDRMSSRHARVSLEGDRWTVLDLGSRNGTHANGKRIRGEAAWDEPGVLRLGRSFFLRVADVRPFTQEALATGPLVERRGDTILGPTLRAAFGEVERAARHGDVLLLSGESGVGKELAARAFHEACSHHAGPFVGVNCAAIPEGLAERLLFGAKRGAYSGAATDSDGYLQAADGGTLFLDEVADLDAQVQAKLLRAIEAREVMALGASRPKAVDLRICSATRDLRAEVASGRFRADLYFRVGRPEVTLPPLRERLEELPWLVAAELARASRELSARSSFIETCLLRPWPGNVRELSSEVRRIAAAALASGQNTVGASALGAGAGVAFEKEPGEATDTAHVLPDGHVIEAALKEHGGNVSRAARALGLHRNQLRRWLARNGTPGLSAPGDGEPEGS